MFTSPKVYVLAVPCPLSFMLFVILAMIMKYIYLSISQYIYYVMVNWSAGGGDVESS